MNHKPRRLPRLLNFAPADADLLARFVASGDAAAFELLARRHAPMVLAACRRVLADANDADDAFQATFLVLARKAGSVARGEVLATWLYRVACRAALRLRADRARRSAREESGAEQLPAPPREPDTRELSRVLDEEVARLPARHRAAFVLCCLEGKTGEEAGRLLGCPPGTVSSRLTRARERLRSRLIRRGFAPAIVTAALLALVEEARAATLPALIASTLSAVPDFIQGGSAAPASGRPAAVAEGVIRTMTTTKLKALVLVLAVGLLAFGGVLAATDRDKGDEPNRPQPKAKAGDEKQPAVPTVRLVSPQRGGLERLITQVGTVEPVQQAELQPGAAGALKRVEVDIGDAVKRGQLLAEIDAPALAVDERLAGVGVEQAKGLLSEAEARSATARAETAAAKSLMKQRESELSAAKANLAFRKKQFERIKELYDQKAVDDKVLDEYQNHLRTAEAQTEAAVAAVENAKSEVAVKNSKVLQAEAAIGTARANVDAAKLGLEKARLASAQTKIEAPFDGVVTRRNCSPGDYVRPGERVADRALFTIVRADTVRVVVAVAEREISQVQVGVPADVTLDALPGVRVSGKVARVGFAVDPANRTMRVEVDIPNAKGEIRPGMFGVAVLKPGKGPADALRVPVGALVSIPQRKPGDPNTAVYVYRDGKARLAPVVVGYQDAKEAEIAYGLAAEDRVVADPKGLAPKTEVSVEVQNPAPPK